MDAFEKMHATAIERLGVSVNFIRGANPAVGGVAYIEMNIDIIDGEGHVHEKTNTVTVLNSFVDEYDYGDQVVIDDSDSPHNGKVFKLQDVVSRDGYTKRIKAYL